MQVKSIAECSQHSAILSTFIKIPFVIKIYVLFMFEWPLKTSLTAYVMDHPEFIACSFMEIYIGLKRIIAQIDSLIILSMIFTVSR